jgi:hypothetical protein
VSLVAFVWNEKSFASVLSFRFCRLELGTGKKKTVQKTEPGH